VAADGGGHPRSRSLRSRFCPPLRPRRSGAPRKRSLRRAHAPRDSRRSPAASPSAASGTTPCSSLPSGLGWSTDYPAADAQLPHAPRGAHADPDLALEERGPRHRRDARHGPRPLPLPFPLHERSGLGTVQPGGGRGAARVPHEGRLPLGGRHVGRAGVALLPGRDPKLDPPRPSDRGDRAGAPAPVHLLQGPGDPPDPVDPVVAAERRPGPRSSGRRRRCHTSRRSSTTTDASSW
jgi:hypothetical protein